MEVAKTPDGMEVKENGHFLTAYHAGRVPYLYPLPSSSGANLARHWPIEDDAEGEEHDHPHHRSMWLSHGAVNGFDFWAWTGKGEPQIKHLRTHDVKEEADGAAFTVDLEWIADGHRQLAETRTYQFHRADPETLWIDLTSRLKASDGEVKFGDTKEGTCALRVDRTLRLKGPMAKGGILDSEGRKDDQCWGKRSKWVAFVGPDEQGEPAVVAMFDHPDNLRFPGWWHARDYGLLAANPFGIHDFEKGKAPGSGDFVLKNGDTLTLRYRILLHHGTPQGAKLGACWEDFSK
ncbi:hypothetical protein Hsar01_00731 [Haloferula sargassicola]|uniref:Methane oxygenase PmoA n=2 Tax=Haloferula sargassicola TaxID=490096 RepID=A0ABP9ULF5_9BACT